VVPPAAAKNAAPLALPLPAVLRQPEEQTDNWDDDFEEGISFSKLQGILRRHTVVCENLRALTFLPALEKSAVDEERQPEHDDNAQTIRPTNRSPRSVPGVISKSPPREIGPIIEDYSDVGIDEDDEWQEKFADFKMKTSVRRGLFHPNDIKTVGLAPASPGAKSAPLPDVNGLGHSRAQSHPLNAVVPLSATPFTVSSRARSHSRSPSFAGSSSGSLGKSDARRLASQEFNKYAEDDDEDYDDVFGKPNGSCECLVLLYCHVGPYDWTHCDLVAAALEHPVQTLQLNTRLSNKSWVGHGYPHVPPRGRTDGPVAWRRRYRRGRSFRRGACMGRHTMPLLLRPP
jgi:hypothetical protein